MFNAKAKLRFEYKDNDEVKWFSLKSELIFVDGKDVYVVPKDVFMFDIASTPPAVNWIFPQTGKYSEASILHDWLYHQRTVSRLRADNLFLKAMKASKVNIFVRYSFYLAVRVGGRSHR